MDDGIVIYALDGLLHGRRYVWFAPDILAVEGRLSPAEQRQAVADAFAEAQARAVRAALAA